MGVPFCKYGFHGELLSFFNQSINGVKYKFGLTKFDFYVPFFQLSILFIFFWDTYPKKIELII
jgi:hypothetical protein